MWNSDVPDYMLVCDFDGHEFLFFFQWRFKKQTGMFKPSRCYITVVLILNISMSTINCPERALEYTLETPGALHSNQRTSWLPECNCGIDDDRRLGYHALVS